MTASTPRSPIAIIGVSALFPGSTDATGFWRDILAGRDLITDVPGTHWRIEDYYDPDPAAPDKTYAKRGGFLPKVDFDALGWGVPPSQMPATDTSQLLALIVAQQVLQDAARGQFEAMDRSRISVILGVTSAQELLFSMVSRLQRPVWVRALREAGIEEGQVQDACARIAAQYVPWQEASFPGLLGNVVAGRIANRLNLGGTNCVTDAACASSLSALAMAVSELQLGHSDLAIAGGVDTLNDIFMYMCFSKTPALSPSGDCRPFSDAADGTMLGEGLGMFALKRLADAERDGDRIYAVLRGLGTSSDGRSKSVYAPVSEGQAQALQRAYAQAGYSPRTVELVEAHGTGTKAGDVAEFNGLRMVYAGDEPVAQPWCALGSVKSQIGHTKAAAGAAGLFKAVMALSHKVLPPTIKVERPDPRLAIDSSPFYLNTRARPWIRGGEHPRRASVSAFGFGGSNFHATLEEYVGPAPRAERLPVHASELVLLHADSVAGLLAKIDAMAGSQRPLAHIAHESRRDWRVDAPRRLALVVDSPDTLRQRLKAAADRIRLAPDAAHALADGSSYGVGAPEGGVAFLFPGQGSQYLDMGAALAMQFDAARGVWDQAAALLLDEGLSLNQVVFPPPVFDAAAETEQRARLTATEHAQPALAAHSAALLALLDELGVRADATAGHSFGELMALHAAGACDLPTALQLARARGIAMRDAARSPGAMSAVSAPVARVRELLAGQREVLVANHNGPQQVVVSGPTEAIAAFEQRLAAERIGFARLPVASAFHSPIVAGASAAFGAALARAPMQSPRLPVYANAEAAPYAGDEETLRGQLAVQLSQPVRFVEMIESMHAAGIRHFVEVGPGQVLCGLVGAILEGRPHQAIALDRKGRDGVQTLLMGLARLAAAGALTRPERLYADVRLPPETLAKPKHAIAIDGSNLGKPYPPPPGTPMPAPNAPRVSIEPAGERAEGAHPGLPSTASVGRGTAQPFPGASGAPEITAPEPVVGRGTVQPFPGTSSPSQHTAPESQAMPNPADFSPAWLAAFQDSQRQAAAAHAAFQQAMADSHAAYLRLTETALAGLGALAGAPMADARVQGLLPQAPLQLDPVTQGTAPAAAPVGAGAAREPSRPVTAEDRGQSPLPQGPLPPGPMQAAVPVGLGSAREHSRPAAAEDRGQSPPPQSSPTSSLDLPALLLSVVADKTGYPVDMLSLDMDLEGDLGIDSIKRVEILAAVDERAPALPKVDRARLGAMRTLAEIVAALGAAAPVGAGSAREPSRPAAAEDRGQSPLPQSPPTHALDLPALLLSVVADKTGYPADMLSLDMDLEGDLGIDSIKRVEILAAVDERAPALPKVDRARLGAMRTLAEIVEALSGGHEGTRAREHAEAARAPESGSPQARSEHEASCPATESDAPTCPRAHVPTCPRIARYELTLIPAPPTGLALPGLLGGGTLHVLGHDTLAPALAAELQSRGVDACAVLRLPADADAAIHLGGLREFADLDAAMALNHEVFAVARQLAQRAPRLFVSVQDSGGCFGLEAGDERRAWAAGLPALVKTAALEWPQAALKAIDIERGGRSVEALAQAIADELLGGGGEIEIALGADGRRRTLRSVAHPAQPDAPVIGDGEVVVVSGGARGVTAACLVEWAKICRARFVLLGRSELAPEPAACAGIADEAGLKRVLLAAAQARGEALTPATLQARVREVLNAREVRATLAAITAAGAQAEYRSVAVEDAAALARTLAEVRASLGPIRGLIHAAGVLADKRIADKSDAAFESVFRTKVGGLRALLEATAGDELKLLAVYSSVSARCGNTGQADYAMANEVLAKVALAQARARPGMRVKSLGWGPWEGGMVNPALRERFAALGVPMIPLGVGARMFVDEMNDAGAVELVLGGEPRPQALLADGADARVDALELKVSEASHAFLAGHAVAGQPVVPLVLVAEWLARAAQSWRPGLKLVALHDLKVLRGIRLGHFGNGGDRLRIESRPQRDGLNLELRVFGARGELHYSARAELGQAAPPPQAQPRIDLQQWSGAPLYQDLLFHRERFELIDAVDGISDAGIAARVRGVADAQWPGEAWQLDAAALDGGLQLAVLYGQRMLGGPNLPMAIEQLRTHAAPSPGPVHATAHARRVGNGVATTDIYVDGADGQRVAELIGVRNVAVGL